MSSNGLLEAVEAALTEAGADIETFKKVVESVSVVDAELTNDAVPTEWDETYDVVVVGGGFSGLAAAHSAANNGANTLIIDKMPVLGGNSAINGGQYASYTSDLAAEYQEKLGLEADTAEQHIEDTLVGGGNIAKEELVEVMVKGSPTYLNQLLDNGLVVRETLAMPGGHTGYRTYVTENSIGSDITKVQEKMVKESGAEIKVNTKLVQIYKDGEKVVGIQVATEDGNKNIKAENGVILATGGFSANEEMRLENNPEVLDTFPTTNNSSSTGEGLEMATGIGAATEGMEWIQLYPYAIPDTGVLDTAGVIPFTGPSYGFLNVDQTGVRFVNESETRDNVSAAMKATGGVTTFSIFTSEVASWVPAEDIESYTESGRIIAADTIEELVEKINGQTYQGENISMDAATLQATIDAHNSYIENGEDPEFGKDMKDSMVQIGEGPYLALAQWPSVHHTMGGVSINRNAQVLDAEGNVIEGLYASGEVTGGLHGTNRLSSNATSDSTAFGMVAGTHAATGTNPVDAE